MAENNNSENNNTMGKDDQRETFQLSVLAELLDPPLVNSCNLATQAQLLDILSVNSCNLTP